MVRTWVLMPLGLAVFLASMWFGFTVDLPPAGHAARLYTIAPFILGVLVGGAMLLFPTVLVPARQIFCAHCGMHASHSEGWICGYCRKEHRGLSFVLACPSCTSVATSYVCPHCDKVNEDVGGSASHPARFASHRETAPRADSEQLAIRAHESEKGRIEREIEMKKLKARLAAVEASPVFKKELSALEREEQDYADHEQAVLGLLQLERRKREEYESKFAGHPDELKMHNLALDQYLLNRGQDPRPRRDCQE